VREGHVGTPAEPLVRHEDEVENVVHSACGRSVRIFTRADGVPANLHVTTINDAQLHYHERCTEYYYIVEGSGVLQVGGERVTVRAGTAVVIPPGVPHRGEGGFRTIVFGVPAWDPEDEAIVR
jgi:mannose-6-phosphate isomerase-like protein (cupin superfamily)